MTEEEIKTSFALTRDAIAGWTHDAIQYVRAGALAEETGIVDGETLAKAERSVEAILEEMRSLSAANDSIAGESDELASGMATAARELDLLGRDISRAIASMRAAI